jgi:hypothetical protein
MPRAPRRRAETNLRRRKPKRLATANERWLHLSSAETDLQSAIQSAAHPVRRGRSEHRGRRRARAIWVLIRAVGAALGDETRPIAK